MKRPLRPHTLALLAALGVITAPGTSAHDFEAGGLYYNIVTPRWGDLSRVSAELTYDSEKHAAGLGSYSGTFEIPETVTHDGTDYPVIGIGDEAFRYSDNLDAITYPSSLTYIGASAFEGCARVPLAPLYDAGTDETRYTNIPSGIRQIGARAFAESGLERVKYYAGRDYRYNLISARCEPEAFKDCKKLRHAVMEVTGIPTECFAGCTALEEVQTGSMTEYIGDHAFAGCSSLGNNYMIMMYGLESIGSYAFDGCTSLDRIDVPASVIAIEPYAFNGCTGLTSVYFQGTQLSSGEMELADSDLRIASDDIFNGCTSVTDAFYGRRIVSDYEGTVLTDPFRGLPVTYVRFADFCLESAFNGADYPGLTSVSCGTPIPPKVAGFTDSQFSSIRLYIPNIPEIESAYSQDPLWSKFRLGGSTSESSACVVEHGGLYYSMTTFGNEVTVVRNPYGKNYRGAFTVSEFEFNGQTCVPSAIGARAFIDCPELTAINLPKTPFTIRHSAFSCTALTSVDLSACIGMESGAFEGCGQLEEVTLSDMLTNLPRYAFGNCPKLARINFPAGLYQIGGYAFKGCRSLPQTLSFADKDYLECSESVFSQCGITDLILPRGCQITEGSSQSLPFGDNPLKNVTVNGLYTPVPLFADRQSGWNKDVETLTVKGDVNLDRSSGYDWENSCWLTDGKVGRVILDLSDSYSQDATWLDGSWNVSAIESHPQTPPAIGEFTPAQYQSVRVTVPESALDAYKAAPVWKEFLHIEGANLDGIDSTAADGADRCEAVTGGIRLAASAGVSYSVYTADGALVASGKTTDAPVMVPLTSGVYVVRLGGTASKLAVN